MTSRGFGGRGGKRSIITDLGGIGRAGSVFVITTNQHEIQSKV